MLVSPALLAELRRALACPKLRRHVAVEDADSFVELLRRTATLVDDGTEGPSGRVRSPDPGDDYLLALAIGNRAALVTGDRHLLDIDAELPIHTPAAFRDILDRER